MKFATIYIVISFLVSGQFRHLLITKEGISGSHPCGPGVQNRHPLEVSLGSIPASTTPDEIHFSLQEQMGKQIAICKVSQLHSTKLGKKTLLPLFLVAFRPIDAQAHTDIMKINSLMGLDVISEKFRGRKGPIQCYNCQAWGHNSALCKLTPKCLKCAEPHETRFCKKSNEIPCICANCEGPHPSNYRKCPKMPKPTQPKRKIDNRSAVRPNQVQDGQNNIANNEVNFPSLPQNQNNTQANVMNANVWTAQPLPPTQNVPEIDLSSTFKEIMDLLKNCKMREILLVIKETLAKIKNFDNQTDKVFLLIEAGSKIINLISE